MFGRVLFDGVPKNASEIPLTAMPSTFFHGVGLFETVKVNSGVPFFLRRHLRRLRKSIDALPLVRPPDLGLLEEGALLSGIDELATSAHLPSSFTMKIVVGDGHVIVVFRPETGDEERHATVERLERAGYVRGDGLLTHKTAAYLRNLLAADSPLLFVNEDHELCEAPSANVFVARGGRLLTPPTDAPALPGIVREVLLETGKVAGLSVEEARLRREDLAHAEACFLTNSGWHARAVVRALGRELPESVSLARKVREALARAAASDVFPKPRG